MVEIGTIPESQLRPLTRLPPDQQQEAWQKAVETAPEGKVTAKHIGETVQQITKDDDTDDDPVKWCLEDGLLPELRFRLLLFNGGFQMEIHKNHFTIMSIGRLEKN